MGTIDTNGWKEFRVGELFDVERPLRRSGSKYLDGNTPFVATSDYRNGVVRFVEPADNETLDAGNCITVSPLNGSAFYQPHGFLGRGGAGSAILILRSCELNENRGLFVAAVLRRVLTKYSYADQINSRSIKDVCLRLPATPSGDPDWTCMDAHMRKVVCRCKGHLEVLQQLVHVRHPVDTADWKRFPIGGAQGLFRIEKGTRLTRADMVEGGYPFIGASTQENGITGYVGNTEHLHPGNVITVAYNGQKATGQAFYQPRSFWASDDVHVLYPRFELNELRALFLLPIFRVVGEPYAFEDKWKLEYMEQDTLPLPVDGDKNPDWAYMEAYMRDEMKAAASTVRCLSGVA